MTQKDSKGLFGLWFKGKKWYRLVNCRKACPLRLKERLVYSFAAYRASHGGTTCAEVARVTRMHAGRTVPAVRDRLVAEGLLKVEGGRLIALPPPRPEWFVFNDKKVENWYQRMRGVPVCHTPRGWTPAVVAVYFVLLSDNVQTGRRINPRQKKKGIAALVGVSHDTVERAYKKFRALGLLDHDYLKEPPAEVLARFPNRPVGTKGPWLASLACGWPFADMADGGSMAKWIDGYGRAMLRRNYSPEEIAQYWAEVGRLARWKQKLLYEFTLSWDGLFKEVEGETQQNRGTGTFGGPNGLGLLRRRTETRLQNIQRGSVGVLELDDVIAPKPMRGRPAACPQPPERSPGVDIEFVPTELQRLLDM